MQTLPGLDLIQDQPWVCEGGSYRAAVSAISNLLDNPELANGQKTLEPVFIQVADGIAYIPIRGILMPRANLFSSFSDYTTLDILELQLSLALGNPAIKGIVLEVDSPGGSASGIAEMAKFIRGAAARRPVFALCRQALSGAYWLACACQFVVATDETSQFGSVGAIIETVNLEAKAAQDGERVSVFTTGDLKVSGHPFVRMTGEQSQYLQDKALNLGLHFLQAITNYRGSRLPQNGSTPASLILADGGTFDAAAARDMGLVDAIRTSEEFHTILINGGQL